MALIDIHAEPVPLRLDPDGVVRIGQTRVALETVVDAFNEGASPEEIAARFDSVPLADVYAVVSYYLRHGEEVEAYIAQRLDAAARTRNKLGNKDQQSIRQRLLARKARDTTKPA